MILRLLAWFTTLSSLGAGVTALRAGEPVQGAAVEKSIPFDQLGEEAQKQYSGDGIGITPTAEGARLRTVFQKLEGHATREGLWITSTREEDADKAERFRVLATEVGRHEGGAPTGRLTSLPGTGTVTATTECVTFARAALTEEYRVSMDGVRQDIIIAERPEGDGALSVLLEVTGAQVTAAPYGAKLTLAGSGREIAYSRLHVTDATGRVLAATLEVISANRLAVQVEDAGAVYPVRIDPTFSDADWVSLSSGISGTNGVVSAMVVDSAGTLYIAGSFRVVGTKALNYIAKWNGSTWSELGSGLNSNGHALAVSGTDLYVAGTFTAAGGVPASRIAKWNGTSWSALGSGFSSSVGALAVSGTDLYVGGSFSSAGGTPAKCVAKWNGVSWSALSSGTNGSVGALAFVGQDLYAAGNFNLAGGVAANRIAKWDGTSWSALGSGLGGDVDALAVMGTDLYAGGDFTSAGGVNATHVAKWDGSEWSALGEGASQGVNYTVGSLAVSSSVLYVGGQSVVGFSAVGRVHAWNGSTWSSLIQDLDGTVEAMAVHGANVFLGGTAARGGKIYQWNGSIWSSLAPAKEISSPINALAVVGRDIYAGGFDTGLLKWNGSSWSGVTPGLSGAVQALAVMGTDLYVGGSFNVPAGAASASHIARWNGSAWSALASGVNGPVHALAANGSTLHVGGSFSTAGGATANNIAKWSGGSWSALSTGVDSVVRALTMIGTDLYAGGDFVLAGSLPAYYVAKWNGSTWSALDNGPSNVVYALATSGTDLYVGGSFFHLGSNLAGNIAKWDGSAWSHVGFGVGGYVRALTFIGGDLYVGSSFTGPASNLAKWNGSAWSPVGSGLDGAVYAIAADSSNHLFVGGAFYMTGTTLSPYVAAAHLQGTPDLVLEQLPGVALADGAGSVSYDPVGEGGTGVAKTFTITNTGAGDLIGIEVTLTGTHTDDFVLDSTGIPAIVTPGSSATFTVKFAPSSVGERSGGLRITSNVIGAKNPYTIDLTGTGLSKNASLAGLTLSSGTLAPAFSSTSTDYNVSVTHISSITVTPTVAQAGATVKVNGANVSSGSASGPVSISVGTRAIEVIVTAPDLTTMKTYTVNVERIAVPGVIEINLPSGSVIDVVEAVNATKLVVIPITRTVGTDRTVGFTIETSGGSAIPGSDYTPPAAIQTILSGAASKLVPITILPSGTVEPLETFTVTISSATGGATLGAVKTVTVRIVDSVDAAVPTPPVINAPTVDALVALTPAGQYIVSGTAKDDKGVNSVKVKLNGNVVGNAVLTAPGAPSTNWSLLLPPGAGANVLAVQSMDTQGKISTEVTRNFRAPGPLAVTVNPAHGSVTNGYAPTSYREIGKSYSISASAKTTPVPGFVFDRWVVGGGYDEGDIDATSDSIRLPALTFTMRAGLTLTAQFIGNPFAAEAGAYDGLVRTATGFTPGTATEGHFHVDLQSTGGFSGKLTLDGLVLNVNGLFDNEGVARFGTTRAPKVKVTRTGKPSVEVALLLKDLDPPGDADDVITGTVTQYYRAAVTGVSDVLAHRAVIPADILAYVPTGTSALFTSVITPQALVNQPAGLTVQDYPQGHSLANITVGKTGTVTFVGTLADSTTPVSISSTISKTGDSPLFAQLYGKLGFLSGLLHLNHTAAESDMTAEDMLWAKPYSDIQHYQYGWPEVIKVDLMGARYLIPPSNSVLHTPDGTGAPDADTRGDMLPVPDADGNARLTWTLPLMTDVLKAVKVSTSDGVTKVSPADAGFSLTITRSTGRISGFFTHPGDGSKPTYQGILYQKGTTPGAYGWFLTPAPKVKTYDGQGGAVTLLSKQTVTVNPETSYHNFKKTGLLPQTLPAEVMWSTARAYGDFFGDGSTGLFTATLTYNPTLPINQATDSKFEFWRRQLDGTFIKDTVLLGSDAGGCLHPRKALVADFNGDDRPDVFVACHGYDAPPFPGERNRIVLSQPGGTYVVQDAAPDAAFFHGAAAADVDNDGDVDVAAVVGGGTQLVFLNNGQGSFTKETTSRLPAALNFQLYFSLEFMDVNEDNRPDLVVGGHEWESAPTRVYLNPGNFNFTAVSPSTLPAVAGESVVLDFLTTGTGATRVLWVLRSSGGDGTFYESRTIQKVRWPGLQSSLPLNARPASWIPWLIPFPSGMVDGVGGDDAALGVWVPGE